MVKFIVGWNAVWEHIFVASDQYHGALVGLFKHETASCFMSTNESYIFEGLWVVRSVFYIPDFPHGVEHKQFGRMLFTLWTK